ncbi:FHA domain-containing protein [Acidicapsa dinghuensis]|uniref:FHA domain-containing protein n=1 Tax=Acidicapsa dinghuensis TaxID=2218256 RepID=A0ABW1ELR4_9BACT|nr:FHA domain-containing protein [Acidicapsa dinghuensis]
MSFIPNLPVQTWIIGRAEDCDLQLPQLEISGHHARLIRQSDQYWIEDTNSSNGVYINGVRIPASQPTHIPPGAVVTLGRQIPLLWPQTTPVTLPAQPNRSGSASASAGNSGSVPKPSIPPPLPGSRVITIGRAPGSDKQVDLPIVSWEHARIVFENGQPILEDLGSRNHTYIDRIDTPVQRAPLDPNSTVYLGSYKIAVKELLNAQRVTVGEAAFNKVEFRGNSMVIGRDPQADVPLDFPMVSWHHARLTREANGILVEDLGSRNGTFVGGIRVSGKVLAKPGQEIGLGSYRFQLLEGGQLAQRTYHGNVTIEAANVVVNAPSGNRLIEPVSMTIFPSELVALMGPAGAGKTTLLKALNGYTKPAEGRVLFNGASLYDYYDQFRQQLGYVPQDDIVHSQLTVGEALYFSARLRTDLSDDEIRARTVKVLDQLRMLDKKDTLIGSPERKTLSGGQRKRVNIALELINDTPVLFLDEPTSGLSSYDAESVIDLLKELSKQGKTIITTIHQPSIHIYKQFDDLIMVNRDPGGKTGSMVYFGPAYPDSIQFLNGLPPGPATSDLSPEMLLSGLAKKSSTEWQQLYQGSRYHQDFVVARPGNQPTPTATGAPGDKPRRHFDLTQWFALVRRNTIVKLRDKTQTAILMIQAPLFATLIVLVYHGLSHDMGEELTKKLVGIHFLMVIAAIWFGCNNAARDIVGEWTVYKRERMVTLRLGSYAFSKLAVLLGLALIQCFFLLGIVDLSLSLKSNFFLVYGMLVLSAMVGTGLGLCISAFSKTTESAIALLPVVLLPIIALGGGLRPAYLLDAKLRWITLAVPSQWALEANLLQETGPNKWPLLSHAATSQNTPAAEQPMVITQDNGKPAEFYCDQQANLAKGQYYDVADPIIPHNRISCPEQDGTMKENFTSKPIEVVYNSSTYKAEKFRHRFRTSVMILAGMLTGLIAAVLGILRMRDNDPQ